LYYRVTSSVREKRGTSALRFLRDIVKRYDARWSFFATIPPQGRILELGCGRGGNALALRGLYPELEIHGLDLLEAAEVTPVIQYHRCDLSSSRLPFPDEHFDAILFIHVIEHLPDLANIISEIPRLLKSGGTIYNETPNFTSLLVPSFGFHREQHYPFNFFDDLGHQRPFSKQSLYEFIERCNLSVEKLGCVRNWLRVPFDLCGILAGFIRGDRPRIVRHFWNVYGWCIYGIGKKI
ncbi:MAG: methyltransferase domain-containing protein, partial [bacterium]